MYDTTNMTFHFQVIFVLVAYSLNNRNSLTIMQRLPPTTYQKDRSFFTQNALESLSLSQPRHDLAPQGNLYLQIKQEPASIEELKNFEDDMLKMIQSGKQRHRDEIENRQQSGHYS